MNERLARQIAFLVEADKLKSVVRRTPLVDLSRLENSAEHSWHLVLVIMVMREYGPPGIDWMRVMEMVAVHDLVEIDAGDVSAYDVAALAGKAVREQAAADGSSASCRVINKSTFDNCGTSSRRTSRRRRGLPMPSIVCSPSSRTCMRRWKLARANAGTRADPAPDGADRNISAGCVAACARRGRVVLRGGVLRRD